MSQVNSRSFLKLLMGFIVICGILSYQNCASQGGGAAPFNISLGSTSPGALTISNISLASSAIQINTNYTAAVTLSGADLANISCTWSVTNSGTAVGASVVTPANSSSVCVATLTAPATVSSYSLNVTATNSGGEVVNTSTSFSTQTSTPPASSTLTLTSSSPDALVNETISLTGTAITNTSGSYSLVIGELVGGVKTPIAGCTTSAIGTTLSFSCPVSFASLGFESLYLDLSLNGSLALDCTANNGGSCLGTYSIDVVQSSSPTPGPSPICTYATERDGQRIKDVPICH